MAMSLTSKQHPYKAGFGPFAPEVYRVAYPYEYRWPGGGDAVRRCARRSAPRLHDAHRARVRRRDHHRADPGRGRLRAGAGGLPARAARDLRRARHRADRRRGADGLRAHRHAVRDRAVGVEPDLVCVAKSIAAGLPLSGVLGRAEIMDAPGDSAIGGTYVGNPVACEAALAVLDEIDRLELCARAREIGEGLTRRMRGLQARVPQLGDVRGLGSMIGLEFVRDGARASPRRARVARRRARAAPRPGPAQGRPLRQRDPQPRAARHHRRAARGGARRARGRDRARRRPRRRLNRGVHVTADTTSPSVGTRRRIGRFR